MAEFDKLNLTPRPIYPEPSPTAGSLPETATPSTYDVGSGSEGGRFVVAGDPLRARESSTDTARDLAVKARDKFQVVAGDAKEKMNGLADRASDIASQAGQRLKDLRSDLNQRLPEWKREARLRADDARRVVRRSAAQADQKARQYPLETIAAAAGAGFLLGATMRIWRSNRG